LPLSVFLNFLSCTFQGIPNFKCTTSWILLFKHRHRNKFVSSATVNLNTLVVPQNAAASDWLITKLPSSWRKLYTDKKIYNASENEMFYKLQISEKSFRFQGNEYTGNITLNIMFVFYTTYWINDTNLLYVPILSLP